MSNHTLSAHESVATDHGVQVSKVQKGNTFEVGGGFSASGFRHGTFDGLMDPLIMVDHYTMREPTFGAHPHAGLAAVSLLFEDSQGRFHNRDSMGNDFDLLPGDLYWMNAAGGAVHDEAPTPGSVTHGLQVFVNLPKALKQAQPSSTLVRASEMPVLESEDYRVRIALGSSNGVKGQASPSANLTILEGTINGASRFSHQPSKGQNTWVYAIDGELELEIQQQVIRLAPGQSVAFGNTDSPAVIRNGQVQKAHFALFSGDAINEDFIQRGPFAMSTEQEIEQANRDFQLGKFGRVD